MFVLPSVLPYLPLGQSSHSSPCRPDFLYLPRGHGCALLSALGELLAERLDVCWSLWSCDGFVEPFLAMDEGKRTRSRRKRRRHLEADVAMG